MVHSHDHHASTPVHEDYTFRACGLVAGTRTTQAFCVENRRPIAERDRGPTAEPGVSSCATVLAVMLFPPWQRRRLGASIAQAAGRSRCDRRLALDPFAPDLAARQGEIIGTAGRRSERFAL